MGPGIGTVEHELADVLALAPRALQEALDGLGDVLVQAVRSDEGLVG